MESNIDTGTEDLLANLDEGVLTLTLNRPEARNAMSGEMTAAMRPPMLATPSVELRMRVGKSSAG